MFTEMILDNVKMPISCPEEQGIPSSALLSFMDDVKRQGIGLHAFEVVRHGKVVASAVAKPFTDKSYHRIYSAAKGVVATGVLVAIQEGYFDLYDRVIPLLPEECIPENLDEKWNELTVYHLLTMNTGHKEDSLKAMWGGGQNWIRTFFSIKPDYTPGTFFKYDMGAQYVMNEIVAYKTGEDIGTFLDKRVFTPLGINYSANFNEYGQFFSSTIQFQQSALTKLGLLYLQEGRWNGKQIIRQDLAVFASLPHCANHHVNTNSGQAAPDNNAGYGLHMWRNRVGGFRFAGGQGQFAVILPEYDMVFSTFAADDDPGRICEAFYSNVLVNCSYTSLPVNHYESNKLQKRLESFNLVPDNLSDRSSIKEKVGSKKYKFTNSQKAESISFEFDYADNVVSVITEISGVFRCHKVGLNGNWEQSEGYILINKEDGDIADLDLIFNEDRKKTLLSGGWLDTNTFVFALRGPALLCDYRYICRFDANELEITIKTRAHNHRKVNEPMGLAGTSKAETLFAILEQTEER